ncbi:hypothetical protein Q7P37_009019 [Cladosporium fusiforme]
MPSGGPEAKKQVGRTDDQALRARRAHDAMMAMADRDVLARPDSALLIQWKRHATEHAGAREGVCSVGESVFIRAADFTQAIPNVIAGPSARAPALVVLTLDHELLLFPCNSSSFITLHPTHQLNLNPNNPQIYHNGHPSLYVDPPSPIDASTRDCLVQLLVCCDDITRARPRGHRCIHHHRHHHKLTLLLRADLPPVKPSAVALGTVYSHAISLAVLGPVFGDTYRQAQASNSKEEFFKSKEAASAASAWGTSLVGSAVQSYGVGALINATGTLSYKGAAYLGSLIFFASSAPSFIAQITTEKRPLEQVAVGALARVFETVGLSVFLTYWGTRTNPFN